MVRLLTWALECDRPQRRRSVLLQVLEVDLEEGRTFEAVRKSILRRGSFQRSDQQAGSGLEKDCLPGPETVHNIQFITTFRASFTMLRYEGAKFWCFLLADLSVGVQTAARAPICSLLCRCSQITKKGCP